MGLLFGIFNIVFGTIILLIGFKIYNPWKGKNMEDQEAEWYKKYGTFCKVGGIVLTIAGIVNVVTS